MHCIKSQSGTIVTRYNHADFYANFQRGKQVARRSLFFRLLRLKFWYVRSCSALQNTRICILDFFEILWYNVFVNKIYRRSDGRDFRGNDLWEVCSWPQFWPSTASYYVETVLTRASESIVFGYKSPEKPPKSRKKSAQISLGRRCRRFESCHSDQNCRFDCFLR